MMMTTTVTDIQREQLGLLPWDKHNPEILVQMGLNL